jgi:hypothetical protein
MASSCGDLFGSGWMVGPARPNTTLVSPSAAVTSTTTPSRERRRGMQSAPVCLVGVLSHPPSNVGGSSRVSPSAAIISVEVEAERVCSLLASAGWVSTHNRLPMGEARPRALYVHAPRSLCYVQHHMPHLAEVRRRYARSFALWGDGSPSIATRIDCLRLIEAGGTPRKRLASRSGFQPACPLRRCGSRCGVGLVRRLPEERAPGRRLHVAAPALCWPSPPT